MKGGSNNGKQFNIKDKERFLYLIALIQKKRFTTKVTTLKIKVNKDPKKSACQTRHKRYYVSETPCLVVKVHSYSKINIIKKIK